MAKKTSWDRVRVRMKTGGGHHWYSSAKAVAFRYFSRVTVSSLQNENSHVLNFKSLWIWIQFSISRESGSAYGSGFGYGYGWFS